MLKAQDIMTRDPLVLRPDDDIAAAARLMVERSINGLPVVDESGKLVGVITQSDLVAQQKTLRLPSVFTLFDGFVPLGSMDSLETEFKKITAMTVADAMTRDPATVGLDTPLDQIAALMVDRQYHTLPVVDSGRLVGVVGKEDVIRTLIPGTSRA
ncbi:MAG: CBS domain-containing protein [Thermodesulfobacteriota bacterium]